MMDFIIDNLNEWGLSVAIGVAIGMLISIYKILVDIKLLLKYPPR